MGAFPIGLVFLACAALGAPAAALERPPAQPDAVAIGAYRSGDLARARAEWTALLAPEHGIEGDERARILYDLGNVAFREGHPLEAVGWYTASLRLRPRDADAWANLEHARREAQLAPADRGDLRATLGRLLGAFTSAEARLLALAGMLAWAATLALEALRGGRAMRWLARGGTLLALLLSTPWLHGAWTRPVHPHVVVEEGQAIVRSEPRADAAVVAEVNAGEQVEGLDALPAWVKVRAPDGTEGWVGAGSVFALER
jgi:hypothetical protein